MSLPDKVVVEYAAAERGYEHQAEMCMSRAEAECEVAQNNAAGLDSYLVVRTIVYSAWTPVA